MNSRAILLIIGLCPLLIFAQEKPFLANVIPHYAKLQYAGSIGFLSVGVGYETKNKKFQGDVMYGYVPKTLGGITIHSFTGKLTWIPVTYTRHSIRINFITAGILVNYVLGHQYFSFSPENYPFDYYDFPTALHAGLFAGGAISKGKLGVYYELGTTDAEFISFLGNTRSVNFTDILHIGAGIRISLK